MITKDIHVDGEGDVFNQDQAVCHSDASQDEVDGVGPHVLVGEDQDVDDVEDSPHTADHHGKIAMERQISFLQMNIKFCFLFMNWLVNLFMYYFCIICTWQ